MMFVALTGTPGVGKTTLSDELRVRGYKVIDLHRFIEEHGLMGRSIEDEDTHEVDVGDLNDALAQYRGLDNVIFMDGHLAHFMDCDVIVVIRCNPSVVHDRLVKRGYSERKVLENVQAEALDVILCESTETDIPVYEIDCTVRSVEESADCVEDIIRGKTHDCLPGSVNWAEEMEKWF